MNLTRSSRYALVALLALALTLGAVGTALAIDFDDSGVPADAEVGESEQVVVEFEAFEERNTPWAVEAESELDDVTVSITATGPGVEDVETSAGSADLELDPDSHSDVTIEAVGDVPTIEQYNYEDPDEENVLGLEISDRDGATLGSWDVHRYTEDSQSAREAIDEASEAVADSSSESAEDDLNDAITFYNNGEFESAINAANSAQETAESEGETRQMLLMAGGVLALAGIVVGGVYFWKSRQTNTNKLQ